MKKLTFLFAMTIFFSGFFAQTKSSQALRDLGYNTPPGVVFGKIDPSFSYADKLNYVSSQVPADYQEPKFMGTMTLEEYLNDQTISQENRAYYQQAKVYFDSLSPKIKTLFSVEELWHIYYFDAVLKENLKSIN
jgi:hypothetical protein